MNRRRALLAIVAGGLAVGLMRGAQAAPRIEVYKSVTCGCCGDWIEHLRSSGFQVRTHDVADPSEYRKRYGFPEAFASCHTALVAGYAIEGHVPAREIRRLLAERPAAQGLAVPGMPAGSPGMEQGGRRDRYEVLLFQRDGRHATYARY